MLRCCCCFLCCLYPAFAAFSLCLIVTFVQFSAAVAPYSSLSPLADLLPQVCYRVLMQLCGQYGHPALAVKVWTPLFTVSLGSFHVSRYSVLLSILLLPSLLLGLFFVLFTVLVIIYRFVCVLFFKPPFATLFCS